ncbi:MAG: hypothetical protein K2Y14_12930 [Burkholderiales bacterium]|nr:hypothetical protein [Burkholderiales bacterium]
MDVTNNFNKFFYAPTQPAEFWGFKFGVSLFMIIFIVLMFVICYIIVKRWNYKLQIQIENRLMLIENRKKITWCDVCDVDTILAGTKTRESATGTETYPIYTCPKCQLTRLVKSPK